MAYGNFLSCQVVGILLLQTSSLFNTFSKVHLILNCMKKATEGKRQVDHQWSSFKESYEDLKLLKSCYEDCVTKVISILGICPPQCLRYYLRQISYRTFYVIERCKLLQDGKCYKKYQYEVEEVDHLISEASDMKTSFDSSENGDVVKSITSKVKRLSYRSIAGMKYLKTLSKPQKLQLDEINRDVDTWLIQVYSAFETDIGNALYNREGVNKNYQFKCKNSSIIDVRFSDKYFQKHKTEIPANHRVKGEDVPGGIIIWFTTEPRDFQVFSEKWNNSIIDGHLELPMADGGVVVYDHDEALREIADSVEAFKSVTTAAISDNSNNKSNSAKTAVAGAIFDADQVTSVNVAMGLGSRLLKKKSTPPSSAFLIQTPDADRLTEGGVRPTPEASSGFAPADHISEDGSVVVSRRSRKNNKYHEYDAENWVDTDDDNAKPFQRSKRKLVAADDEYETVKNSGPLELHKSSSKKANRQANLQKSISNRLQQSGTTHKQIYTHAFLG